MWSIGRSSLSETALPLPLEIRPIRGARRMRLRIDTARGVIRLTCPWRASRRAALRWALEQRGWIADQLAALPPAEPFVPGATIMLEGRPVKLVADGAGARRGRLVGDELRIGGPESGFARRAEQFLKARALAVMSAEVAEFARRIDLRASAVTVGDAATRWGSCSSAGRIRLSWRLIMASPEARRFVVAHEVAHLRHLDHGRDFKRLESELFGPGLAAAKAKLRLEGPRLRRLGRG